MLLYLSIVQLFADIVSHFDEGSEQLDTCADNTIIIDSKKYTHVGHKRLLCYSSKALAKVRFTIIIYYYGARA